MKVVLGKNARRVLKEVWELLLGFGMAFFIYVSLGYALNTPIPLTAVVSDSMIPNYYKGDMLVVYGTEYKIGDVIVYQNPKTNLPVVHRIINETRDGFITKGDNNPEDDITGGITDRPVTNELIKGKAVARIPFLGWVKILFMRYAMGYPI